MFLYINQHLCMHLAQILWNCFPYWQNVVSIKIRQFCIHYAKKKIFEARMSMFHPPDQESLFNIFYEWLNFPVLGPSLNFSPTNRSPFLNNDNLYKVRFGLFQQFCKKRLLYEIVNNRQMEDRHQVKKAPPKL